MIKSASTFAILLPVTVLALGGCANTPRPPLTLEAPPSAWNTPLPTSDTIRASKWWQAFGNTNLNQWVEKARAHNLDLRVANANLKAARALVNEARAVQGPSGSVDASLQRLRQPAASQPPGVVGSDMAFKDQTLFDEGLNLGWQLDLSGSLRAAGKAAQADTQLALWQKRQTEVSIVAETVNAYIGWRTALNEHRILAQRLNRLEAIYNSQRQAGRTGIVTSDPADAVFIELESLRAELPVLEASARQAERRLAVLSGESPQAVPNESRPTADDYLTPPAALPMLDPQASLRLRPDVGIAEEQIAGALARARIARADLYPSITLIGALGRTGDPNDIASDNALRFSVGPQLTWGLFNIERTRARIRAADARSEAAYLTWHKATLSALEESEGAIDSWNAAIRAQTSAHMSLMAATHLADQTQIRQDRGLVSRVEYMRAEDARLAWERAELKAQSETARAWVRACLALGGGWSEDEPES